MPARDLYHDCVRIAPVKDGWTITHDPYVVSVWRGKVFVDLGAEQPLAAEKEGRKIAVEIKRFLGESELNDFERAMGQYVSYRSLISRGEPERTLYLAIPANAYESVFQGRITQPVVAELSLPLLVSQPEARALSGFASS